MEGIPIVPGIIDTDFKEEIKVMSHPPHGISEVKTGQRCVELIILPKVQTRNQIKGGKRGECGFISSDTTSPQ